MKNFTGSKEIKVEATTIDGQSKMSNSGEATQSPILGGFRNSHSNDLSSDAELLGQFVASRDQWAFEKLLHRHGPMVLGVCRRTLNNEADAEDAFQATFLVLVRKANSIWPRNMVGNWLFGVAHNTALKARAMATKRANKEQKAAERQTHYEAESDWSDLQPVLDRELQSLPDKYRSAIVLCDLEGLSLKEAARQLGCPLATVGTRVARGRSLLAQRLSKRNITLSVAALAMLLAQNGASASVPAALFESTSRIALSAIGKSTAVTGGISTAVTGLAAAVLRAFLLSRLKLAVLVALVVMTTAVAGTWAATSLGATNAAAMKTHRKDASRIQNTWTLVSVQHAGLEVPKSAIKEFELWTFDAFDLRAMPRTLLSSNYRIDGTKAIKEIDLKATNCIAGCRLPLLDGPGIYKLEKSVLTICVPANPGDTSRPTEFASIDGSRATNLFVFERKRTDSDRCNCK